jgi:hypothetical protein
MTVGELKDLLEGLDDDIEVRLAMQPAWPFEYSIDDSCLIEKEDEDNQREETILYLVEGDQLGYLPGDVCDELGWK